MSKDDWKELIPDTFKEWSFLAKSINRLGGSLTLIGTAYTQSFMFALWAGGLTWLGWEVSEYIKLHYKESENGIQDNQ